MSANLNTTGPSAVHGPVNERLGPAQIRRSAMTRTHTSIAATIFLAGALSLAGAAAFAASGGGSSSSGASTPSCNTGYVWNAKTGKCEKKTSSNIDDKS